MKTIHGIQDNNRAGNNLHFPQIDIITKKLILINKKPCIIQIDNLTIVVIPSPNFNVIGPFAHYHTNQVSHCF